jgi:hypothetical protein
MKKCMVVASFFAAALAFGSDWEKRDSELGRLDSKLQHLANEIKSLQGKSPCETDQQCKVVGLGGKVCGHPKDFLVYSVLDTQENLLLARVEEFNRLHQKVLELKLSSASCGKAPAPIRCVSGSCQPDL